MTVSIQNGRFTQSSIHIHKCQSIYMGVKYSPWEFFTIFTNKKTCWFIRSDIV